MDRSSEWVASLSDEQLVELHDDCIEERLNRPGFVEIRGSDVRG